MSSTQSEAVLEFRNIRSMKSCHADFNLFFCTQFFPGCPFTSASVSDPCQSLCQAVSDSCAADYNRITGEAWPYNCSAFPDTTCIPPSSSGGGRARRDLEITSLDIDLEILRKNPKALEFFKFDQLIQRREYFLVEVRLCIASGQHCWIS